MRSLFEIDTKDYDINGTTGSRPSARGIIIKDGTDLYNGFGIGFSQCISHIQRYLKGIYDFVEHKGPRRMAKFLTKYNNYRNEIIQKGRKNKWRFICTG